jgi:hypothetical protein
MIAEGLDDYTKDGRGDIGSLVRVEALRATSNIFRSGPLSDVPVPVLGQVLRLAGEKLDKVRGEAKVCLLQLFPDSRYVFWSNRSNRIFQH